MAKPSYGTLSAKRLDAQRNTLGLALAAVRELVETTPPSPALRRLHALVVAAAIRDHAEDRCDDEISDELSRAFDAALATDDFGGDALAQARLLMACGDAHADAASTFAGSRSPVAAAYFARALERVDRRAEPQLWAALQLRYVGERWVAAGDGAERDDLVARLRAADAVVRPLGWTELRRQIAVYLREDRCARGSLSEAQAAWAEELALYDAVPDSVDRARVLCGRGAFLIGRAKTLQALPLADAGLADLEEALAIHQRVKVPSAEQVYDEKLLRQSLSSARDSVNELRALPPTLVGAYDFIFKHSHEQPPRDGTQLLAALRRIPAMAPAQMHVLPPLDDVAAIRHVQQMFNEYESTIAEYREFCRERGLRDRVDPPDPHAARMFALVILDVRLVCVRLARGMARQAAHAAVEAMAAFAKAHELEILDVQRDYDVLLDDAHRHLDR